MGDAIDHDSRVVKTSELASNMRTLPWRLIVERAAMHDITESNQSAIKLI